MPQGYDLRADPRAVWLTADLDDVQGLWLPPRPVSSAYPGGGVPSLPIQPSSRPLCPCDSVLLLLETRRRLTNRLHVPLRLGS
jgi:hypothetical protein